MIKQKTVTVVCQIHIPSNKSYNPLLLPLVLAMLERQLSNLDGRSQVRLSTNFQPYTSTFLWINLSDETTKLHVQLFNKL
jgi:hypothetical protein